MNCSLTGPLHLRKTCKEAIKKECYLYFYISIMLVKEGLVFFLPLKLKLDIITDKQPSYKE